MARCIRLIKTLLVFLITAFLLQGCGKETKQKNFIARVNDSYLTKEELASMIDTGSASNFYRSEVIRNWINREVLYQQAEKQGLLKDDNFRRLMEESKKELAGSLLLQKYYEDEKSSFNPSDIENFYELHKDEFKCTNDSYLINRAVFDNQDEAIRFRSIAIESDWNKALNAVKNQKSLLKEQTGEMLYNYEIYPVELYRVISEMDSNEVSTVITEAPGRFTVVKLIQKYLEGAIPPFDAVKSAVIDEYTAQKKEELLNNYLKDLYSKNKIEVRN